MSERKPWFPSNGTEGDFVQEKFCDNCENDKNQDCEIIAKALFHTSPGEKIKEWTAIDIYGRGFQCDNFRPKQGENQ